MKLLCLLLVVIVAEGIYGVRYEVAESEANFVDKHIHIVDLTDAEVNTVKSITCNKRGYVKKTSTDAYHHHNVALCYDGNTDTIRYNKCDGSNECWDHHPKVLSKL